MYVGMYTCIDICIYKAVLLRADTNLTKKEVGYDGGRAWPPPFECSEHRPFEWG